ncbi:mycothiol system anti-sigma-R factor [Oerskovia sp. M15]
MTSEDQVRMRAHVAHCSPCLAELSAEELVKQLVRRSCHEQAPVELRLRIQAQFTVQRTPRRSRSLTPHAHGRDVVGRERVRGDAAP